MAAKILSVQPVLAVHDVPAAIAFYGKLGFKLAFHHGEHPQYAGVCHGDVEIHLQWHAAEEWDTPADRPIIRFVTDDPDALHAEFMAAGLSQYLKDVFDSSWGTREFHMYDLDRNILMFYRDR